MWRVLAWVAALGVVPGCAPGDPGTGGNDLATPTTADLARPSGDLATSCVPGQMHCYTVYAHGDHYLYRLDLGNRALVPVGPFRAPMVSSGGMMFEDVITDLAVSPDDVVYVVSHTRLYTADPVDGHVTERARITSCGTSGVALSFAPDGKLYAGDYQGAFCRIDLATNPPTVTRIGTLSDGLALSGDIVVVGDGTMYGTALRIADVPNGPTVFDNYLVKIDPQTAQTTIVGQTGFPRLYGAAYEQGKVFAFTHNGSGRVAIIDPRTGAGTLYSEFADPTTGMNIVFAGAGVNPRVEPVIM